MNQNDEGVSIPDRLLDEHGRLLSLDFFRGLVMFLLISDFAGIWETMASGYFEGTVLGAIATQFHHDPWHGLRFWDLVQPFFMFIVGVAMPISFGKRWGRGDTWWETFEHALKRSLILLALGVLIYTPGFELWNVLSQLSFTYLVAFLIMRKNWKFQVAFSIGLLLLTEGLYRFWPVAGFDQPFTPDKNFGAWLDLVLMGKLSDGHWVAVNALPTAAHTIWGVLAGYVLISDREATEKIKILVGAGLLGVVVGYALDPVTPIIKRIATTSFVIVTGGWSLLALAFSFWLLDVKKTQIGTGRFFAIVGMNPIFIYLFAHEGGAEWLREVFNTYITSVFSWVALPEAYFTLITCLVVQGIMWYMLYFLYDREIFIKI